MKAIALILGVTAFAVTPTLAHEGPRFWIGAVNNRITTFTSDNDLDPTIYTPSRIFTIEFVEIFGIYTTEFPGFEVRQMGGNVAAGTTFGFNLVGPALYYDADLDGYVTTAAMFGPPAPGPVPQLAVSLGANIRVTSSGPVAGFDFFTFNQIGDHSHLSYTLLGDGVTASDGPAGVYALPLNLTSLSLTTSETFYLLVGKDVEQTDPLFQSAISAAQATLVPVSGDMNCSGALDAADVSAFVQAVLDPDAYEAAHPSCDILHGDMNGDHSVDGRDVQVFVAAMLGS